MTWESIPTALLDDLSQLVKANSIEGNKRDNQQIIYTPWSNIKKTGDLAVGTVTFHNDHKVRAAEGSGSDVGLKPRSISFHHHIHRSDAISSKPEKISSSID